MLLTLARCFLALYVAVSCVQTPSRTTGRVSRLNIVSWFSFLWNQRTFPFSISKWYCPSLCLEWLPTVSNMDWMPLLVSSLIHVAMVIPSLGTLSKCAPSNKTSPPVASKWQQFVLLLKASVIFIKKSIYLKQNHSYDLLSNLHLRHLHY